MDVLKTLKYLKPDIRAIVWENDIDRIEYDDSETFKPTKKEILEVDQTLVEEWDKKSNYADFRLQEYGSWQEQLDFIVHNGIDAFIERNIAIKSKYPKK